MKRTPWTVCFFIITLVLLQLAGHYQKDLFSQPKNFSAINSFSKKDPIGFNNQFENSSCSNKTKFMFSKNSKTGGTTVASIILQIATHYRKYEVLEYDQISYYLENGHPNIGYHFTHWGLNVPKFKKLFPKQETLWISTVRNVPEQINSLIRFFNLQHHYSPGNFDKTLMRFKKGGSSEVTEPFRNGGISFILSECLKLNNFQEFKKCAQDTSSEFDLIIPIHRLNEGLIMLHKITCYPLSDFAYMKKKVSSGDFKLSQQNMSTLLSYHEKSIWFYNRSVDEFNHKFNEFQSQFCVSHNCRNEIDELKEENRKLESACGVSRSNVGRFSGINLNWDKLKRNESLALRCMSLAVDDSSQAHFKVYNKYIRENDNDILKKTSQKWIEMTINRSLY